MKKKRKYTAPTITEHSLDKNVCLAMSSIGNPPGNPSNPFRSPKPRNVLIFEDELGKKDDSPFGENIFE